MATATKPIPFGTEAQVGPWMMTVTGVATGQDAANRIAAASEINSPPADGFQYVLVGIRVRNQSAYPLQIRANDFAMVGESGSVYRFVEAIAPEPALGSIVEPGETGQGWIVGGAAAKEEHVFLFYDSLTISGNWARAVFALETGGNLPQAEKAVYKVNKAGTKPDRPALLNQRVVTRDWAVEIVDVVYGQGVYNLFPASDYRTTALGSADPAGVASWLALLVKVTNNQIGDVPAFFSPVAFTLSDGDGNSVPDVLTLSAPNPDASGYYAPGTNRQGWVVFQLPGDYQGTMVRFLAYRTDTDPRFINWSGDAAEPPPPASLAVGAMARTVDSVNLRTDPSTTSSVVVVLSAGARVKVTGAERESDGYEWYPVDVDGTGESGWVAANYLEPDE